MIAGKLGNVMKVNESNARGLRFLTGAEIATETPAQTNWIARPWVAPGAITEVDGKPKVAGKTTWLLHLARAVLDGEVFLDEPTTKSPVVYLTKQSRATFAVAMKKVGLLGRDDFSVLFWPHTVGYSWRKIVAAAVRECMRIEAKLLIIDTLPQFAQITGDAENNAGDALAVMYPLQRVAAVSGLAIVVTRHERKAGGDVGDPREAVRRSRGRSM
jgi:hypothetical protein